MFDLKKVHTKQSASHIPPERGRRYRGDTEFLVQPWCKILSSPVTCDNGLVCAYNGHPECWFLSLVISYRSLINSIQEWTEHIPLELYHEFRCTTVKNILCPVGKQNERRNS